MKFQVSRTSGVLKDSDGCEAKQGIYRHKDGNARTWEWHEKEFASFEELLAWMKELKETEVVLTDDRLGADAWEFVEGSERPEAGIEIYDDYRE